MSEKIRVSVIIPVYNSESYLSECMDSVLSQSLRDIEIICIDDGSDDASLPMLREFKKKDVRVKIIEQPHINGSAARNKGLEIARGEYLAFMDADDYYLDDALKIAYSKAKREDGVDVVVFGANEYNVANKREKFLSESLVKENCPDHDPFSPDEMADKLFNSFHNWPWNKLFRRSFIEENKIVFQDVERSNDVMFVSLALASAKKITLVDQALICHRVGHGTNVQAKNAEHPLAFWKAFQETKNKLQELPDHDQMIKSFLNGTLYAFRNYLDSVSDDRDAFLTVKKFMIENGEKDFSFLAFGREYYDRKQDYDWYLSLRDDDVMNQEKRTFFSIISGVIVSLKENGLSYTVERILFHLGLRADNDPERTRRSKNRH